MKTTGRRRKIVKKSGEIVIKHVTQEEHDKVKRFEHEPQIRQQLDRQLNLLDLADGEKNRGVIYDRAMMPVRWISPIGFQEGSEACFLPLRLEIYQKCDHRCHYCFSQTLDRALFRDEELSKDYIDKRIKVIKKAFVTAFDRSKKSRDFLTLAMRRKIPFHLSVIYDGFQRKRELKYGISYRTLKILDQYDYPVMIQTKGDSLMEPKYVKLIERMKDVVLQISISTHDDTKSKLIEPDAPLASRRIEMMQRFNDSGVPAVARISPFVPHFTDMSTFQHLLDREITHISLRELILKKIMRKQMQKATGKDLVGEYVLKSKSEPGGKYYLPISEIYHLYKPIVKHIIDSGANIAVATPAPLYLMGNLINCCGYDKGAFSPNKLQLCARTMANMIQYAGTMNWSQMKSLCRSEMHEKKFKDRIMLMWDNLLWGFMGLQIIDIDDDNHPVFRAYDIHTDPKLKGKKTTKLLKKKVKKEHENGKIRRPTIPKRSVRVLRRKRQIL